MFNPYAATWITFDEVCRRFSISRKTLDELVHARKVPFRVQHGQQCFVLSDLERFFMKPGPGPLPAKSGPANISF
jgi:predicted DNA-binding transcriptional regulator AlpA